MKTSSPIRVAAGVIPGHENFAAAGVITPDVNFIDDAKYANRGVFFEPMSILIRLLISV